ncbi:Lsr2 family protein [Demequina sp. SYSU T00192]|uniref:Lsr2 family protein n=1 Tax=Demequina litoralis TaxID=3051660 RepID=A0ABT8G8J8_9MICO|nr:Lsr2 family protein [Demequina sp. SYSU T00192]MDN4475470.1 Lsr2 family protein [Demequina sp. SYSU T00192]
MAQKVQVVLVDDIDGSTASETVSFSLDGSSYEVDLNEQNASALRDALAPWISAGRRTASRKATARKSARSSGGDAAAIRAWAKANGVEVPERGRIPAKVREAYDAAQ